MDKINWVNGQVGGTPLSAENLNQMEDNIEEAIQSLYPVGSIYLSVTSTNPNTLFGFGTWTQIAQGRTLVGVDTSDTDFDTVQETGGSKTTNKLCLSGQNFGGLQGGTSSADYKGRVWVSPDTYVNSGTTAQQYPQSIVQPYYTCYIWLRTA